MFNNKRLVLFSIVLSLVGCKPINKSKDLLFGNWKSSEKIEGPKYETEVFIDSTTINIFSEETNDIIFSNYYKLDYEKIYILEKDRLDTLFEFHYSLKTGTLKLTGGGWETNYVRVVNGKTLEEYIRGRAKKSDYIKDFYSRKN